MRQEQLDPLVRRETSVLPDRLVLLVPRGQPVQLALQGTSDRLVLLVQWVLLVPLAQQGSLEILALLEQLGR